jgi:hypothetical protein
MERRKKSLFLFITFFFDSATVRAFIKTIILLSVVSVSHSLLLSLRQLLKEKDTFARVAAPDTIP